MTKQLKLSKDAKAIVNHLGAKAIENPAFQKQVDDLLKNSDEEIIKGLAIYIKNEFPDLVDQHLEAEILKGLRSEGMGGGIIDLARRSRQRGNAGNCYLSGYENI